MGVGAAAPLPRVCEGEWGAGRGELVVRTDPSPARTTTGIATTSQPTLQAVDPNCPENWGPQELSGNVHT